MARVSLCIALALAAAACGVPEKKYQAAVDESARRQQSLEDAERQIAACDRKVAELTQEIAQEKAAKATATAEAAQQKALAGRLAQTKEQLEAEKAALEQRSKEYASLAASLDKEIKAGQIRLTELRGKLTVRLAEKVLFASGSATIGRPGREALSKIAEAFHDVKDRIIRVEGHTDDVPIHTARFPSNWELSAARAIAVVRLLQDEGVDPSLLGAAGYAQYQPVASNETREGRAENRRIEISLAAPPEALPTSPAPKAP